MCLAIPGKIQSIQMSDDGQIKMAKASFGGIIKEVSLEMCPEAEIDDYVLVHVGVAISIVNENEAKKVYDYLKFADELNDLDEDQLNKILQEKN